MLGVQLEEELKWYCLEMERKFFGLSRTDVMRMAFKIASVHEMPNTFNATAERAGKKWLKMFLARHPELSIRTPQPLSAARMLGFTPENVARFFDVFEEEMKKIKFNPVRLWNVDETGITIVQHKTTQVIGRKGKRQVASLSSAERGRLITVVTCMSAGGQHMPAKLIWPRQRMNPTLMNGTPPGTTYSCHESGWIQTDSFAEWFTEFIHFTKPTEQDPVVLVLDGHYSHVRNLGVILEARKNFVSIVCLPPHCTHRMQPLDKSFMSPFKTKYALEIEMWLKHNPGKKVSIYQVGELFGRAFLKAASYSTAVNGFRATGLFPTDRNYFTADDFAIDSKDKEKTPESLKPVEIRVPDGQSSICAPPELSHETPTPERSAESTAAPKTIPEARQSIISIAADIIGPMPSSERPPTSEKKPSPILITGSPHKRNLEEFKEKQQMKAVKSSTSQFLFTLSLHLWSRHLLKLKHLFRTSNLWQCCPKKRKETW